MDEPVDEYVGRHRLRDEADSDDQVRPTVVGRDRTDTGQRADTGQMEVSGRAGRGVSEE
jgi:hypothetical protein